MHAYKVHDLLIDHAGEKLHLKLALSPIFILKLRYTIAVPMLATAFFGVNKSDRASSDRATATDSAEVQMGQVKIAPLPRPLNPMVPLPRRVGKHVNNVDPSAASRFAPHIV